MSYLIKTSLLFCIFLLANCSRDEHTINTDELKERFKSTASIPLKDIFSEKDIQGICITFGYAHLVSRDITELSGHFEGVNEKLPQNSIYASSEKYPQLAEKVNSYLNNQPFSGADASMLYALHKTGHVSVSYLNSRIFPVSQSMCTPVKGYSINLYKDKKGYNNISLEAEDI